VNESRSTRYHRARRRASAAIAVVCTGALAGLVLAGGSAALRDLVRGSVPAFAAALALLLTTASLPIAYHRSFQLERQYELVDLSPGAWLRDYAKGSLVVLPVAVLCTTALYATLDAFPRWWWLVAAAGGTSLVGLMTLLAPVVLLPRIHTVRPLRHGSVRDRLAALANRAGIPLPVVHEWHLGDRGRRARAAVVGAGATRRILLSDRLLADYSDDEIEIVLAHEIGHHVHGDVRKALAADFVLLAACFLTSSVVLNGWWASFGLDAPSDIAGAPILLLVSGGVTLIATPILNVLSRRNERRADAYALQLASKPGAFITAMRRMAAQNLADDAPSRAAFWMCHTHPLVEERIAAARVWIGSAGDGDTPTPGS
jgi:STE24 endopeptidase